MSTKAVIKAWHSAGGQYIFWNTSQISNPLLEYPTGSPGYPATNLLSDFVLLDYEGTSSDNYSNGVLADVVWALGVEDGYAVYTKNSGAALGIATAYSTSRIIGVAYSETDKVVTEGQYDVYCSGLIEEGDPVYLSESTTGVLTATPPRTITQVVVKVGTCIEEKTVTNVSKIKIYIDPDEPMELQETIEI